MANLQNHKRQVPLIVELFSKLMIRLSGWEVVGDPKSVKKAVMITQHTSNWDGFFALFAAFSLGIRPRSLAKDKLLKGIQGPILRWAGLISIDRSKNMNVVDQVAQFYENEDHLWLFVAPGATRKKTDYWKTGFYYIALKAEVPIVQAILDYERKQVGIGTQMMPSGDIEVDMDIFRAWYADHHPKYPEKASVIRLKP